MASVSEKEPLRSRLETNPHLTTCVCARACPRTRACGVGVGVQIQAGKCLLQCPPLSRHPLTVSCHLSLSYPGDKGDRSWSRALPTPAASRGAGGRPSGGRAAQGPWAGGAAPAAVSLALAAHGAQGAAQAGFPAMFLEIISLCPSSSSLFLPHFFPPG